MKKIILIVFFTVLSNSIFAQSMESMKIEAEKAFTNTYELNYNKILDGTYPKVFEILDRKLMLQVLKSTFEGNEEMSIKLNKVDPNFKFGEIFSIGNQKFCFIDHDLSLTLIMKEKMKSDEAEMMLSLFKTAMETEDITYNKKERSFTINKVSTMIAISDEYTKNEWKFINKDKNNVLAKKLFSDEVIERLGL
jgi:hypothetical protein